MVDTQPQGRQSVTNEAQLVQMLKALGDPVRFGIMQTLAERQACITQEIVATTPLAQSTVSQHLMKVKKLNRSPRSPTGCTSGLAERRPVNGAQTMPAPRSSPVNRALLRSTNHLWSCGRQQRDASPITRIIS